MVVKLFQNVLIEFCQKQHSYRMTFTHEAENSLALTWMMAGESCLAAQCMGVSPLRSLMSVRAWLSSNSSFTHTASPRSHARCSGV